uniref:Peptide-N(4)-(N-acetyl-beta-glucosaminyl)asparagine amidase n=1 Tax=Photinus pyralis TaxID=7054 RepID=A0A1Y1M5T0_PHOPY
MFRNALSQELNTNVFAQLIQDEPSGSSSDSSIEPEPSKGAIPKVSESAKSANNTTSDRTVPRDVPLVVLPPMKYLFTNPFLNEVELAFHTALSYADKDLQNRALAVIPKLKLENNAQNRLRKLQETAKEAKVSDFDYTLDDFLLPEVLDWFKNEFFKWVDSPDCQYCNGNTFFAHMSDDPSLLIHTNRVEMHKCHSCHRLTPFPRYNDVNILLLTRCGRCGEWANTFTLICCAMGWDARLIVDQTDHVWTEVFMHSQKRWLHCDPCENVCDTPLMYENGWGKQVSYVIAYSSEEVQDVTWRYSSNHKTVLRRRTKCTEKELVDALIKLRNERQRSSSKARVDYLTKRVLLELVELMCEKKASDKEKQGRTSGSELWRLMRGEIQPKIDSYVFVFKGNETETVRYSAALDKYECAKKDGSVSSVNGWHAGAFNMTGIFRKEEKDWKMVYLARAEGTDFGVISWKFEVEDATQVIDVVDVKLEHKLYENGKVEVTIESNATTIKMPENTVEFRTTAVSGSRFIVITARLSGGKGDVAWQHAQLFRQTSSSSDFAFIVKCSFKPVH